MYIKVKCKFSLEENCIFKNFSPFLSGKNATKSRRITISFYFYVEIYTKVSNKLDNCILFSHAKENKSQNKSKCGWKLISFLISISRRSRGINSVDAVVACQTPNPETPDQTRRVFLALNSAQSSWQRRKMARSLDNTSPRFNLLSNTNQWTRCVTR